MSQVEVEGVGVTQYKAEVRVVNRLPIHDSYHLGFKIRLESITEYGNGTVQEEEHFTGVGAFPFDVELGKRYNATVWAITHEGYGVGTTHQFISMGDCMYTLYLVLLILYKLDQIVFSIQTIDRILIQDMHHCNDFTRLCNFSGFFHPIRNLQPISCCKNDVMSEDIAVKHIMNF